MTTPEILFVCVHNQGRSQMAAALVRLHGGDRIRVSSAGSDPADGVSRVIVEAMRELGVDVTGALPRRLADEDVLAADVVVTMGCGDACPVYPGKRYEDWQLADPSGKQLGEVRRIRDEIDERVRALLRELGV